MNFIVKRIEPKETLDFILNKHYAQRKPSISYSFGLFSNSELLGVCTIGKPASPSLCKGICGEEYSSKVFELNRLVVEDNLPKNTLSFFVSRVLRELKKEDLVIVSYADSGMNHHGYIYQACNFLYTGATLERTDKYAPNNKHSRHYDDKYSHLRKVRTSKHRYVYFTNKNNKKMRQALKYPILPYPKGENENYVLGSRIRTKVINTDNGEYFYE